MVVQNVFQEYLIGEKKWLNQNNIPDDLDHRQVYIKISGHKWKVDGFKPEINTIFEYLGDYWHRKPTKICPR